MAAYGLDWRTGQGRAASNGSVYLGGQGWTPTLGPNAPGGASAGAPYIAINGVTGADDRISKAFRRSGPMGRIFQEMIVHLLAGNANTAHVPYLQIRGTYKSPGQSTTDANFGGIRPIDNLMTPHANRAFTSSDRVHLYSIFRRTTHPGAFNQATAGYVRDASGNGGGGKAKW